MPAAVEYGPDVPALREAAESELRARRETHAASWLAYLGRHKRHLATRPGEPDDNTTINLVKQAVDRLVAFLVPRFPGLELDERRETAPETWLRTAWEYAGGAALLARMAKYGCLDGHIFARVVPAEPYPRIVALNPANVIVFWQGDDYERVLWYELRWAAGGIEFRQDVIDQGGAWLIRDMRREGAGWAVQGESAWPWPRPPISDWAHDFAADRYYGVGEAANLTLNDRVNRVAGDISRILRFHAAPRTVGIGFTAEDVTATGIDHFWTIPTKEAQVFNLEMQGDLASSLNFLTYCTRAFMSERRVILLEGSMNDLRHITNLGIRALYLDQLTRTQELRRAYEAGIGAISRTLLMLMPNGGTDLRQIEAGRVKVNWPDPLPVGDLEALEALERERALGILSRETAARERGRDWPLEMARLGEEVR